MKIHRFCSPPRRFLFVSAVMLACVQGCDTGTSDGKVGPLEFSPGSIKMNRTDPQNFSITNKSELQVHLYFSFEAPKCNTAFTLKLAGSNSAVQSGSLYLDGGVTSDLILTASGDACSGASFVIEHTIQGITNPIYIPLTAK